MKVLLTTLNSKFIHTNLAIRYIREYSRYLEGDKYELFMREYTINNSIDFIMKDIYKLKVDVLVFSVYIWNVEDIVRLCENIKKVRPNIKIALGGPEVSYDCENAMKKYPFVDYILYGEGEVVYRDLMLSLMGDLEIDNVRGICHRKGKKVIVNEAMPLIENLDEIPSPYESIDKSEYENKIVYFESSRGCPFNCQYCLSSAIKGLRYFSVPRIKRDLKNLIDARVSQIKFIDRTFNANREIAKDVMNFLMENDNGYTTYHFEVTAHLIDDDMLEFLKDCKPGLFQFEIGVQSTNDKTLEAVGRKDDFERLTKVVNTISGYRNIHQHLDLIAGLPYENYERFGYSFDDVFALKSECLQLGFLKMIKGTGIRNEADIHDYLYKDYPPYEILSNKYISYGEILKLKDIEEILETYYNSGNFLLSTEYVINSYYDRPFKFFEDFAVYFNQKGYFDVLNGKNRLYEIFLDFFSEVVVLNKEFNKARVAKVYLEDNKITEKFSKTLDISDKIVNEVNEVNEVEIFRDILKFDYVALGRSASIPKFFNRIEVDDFKNRGHQFLKVEENQRIYTPEHLGEAAKNIIRHVQFEEFRYNVIELKNNPNAKIERKQNTVLFYYDIYKIFEKSKAFAVKI